MFNTILVANTAEAFKDVLLKDKDAKGGQGRIRHELALSQRAFFWEADNKVVVTPNSIPAPLINLNKEICGYRNVSNLAVAPVIKGVELSRSMMVKRQVMEYIALQVRENPQITMSPYAVTRDFVELLDALHAQGVWIESRERPSDASLWTVPYLDSKAGFRAEMLKLVSEHGEIKVPQGFLALDAIEAQEMAEWLYGNGQSSILKANFGESGWGIHVVRVQDHTSLPALRRALRKTLASDVIWQSTSIVVEQFVDRDVTVAGSSPSTEVFVDESGAVITYHCGQVINEFGKFLGVEIGKDAVPQDLATKLTRVGSIVGTRYWELGYRGFFDIDLIVSQSNDLYVVETNARRTGGTHTYDLARHLFGSGWERDAYFLSHDSFHYSRRRMDAEALLRKVKPVLYPMSGDKKGIVVTLISDCSPVMGYIVITSNPDEGRELQQRLFGLFEK